jgi:hypothetical protein
MALIVASGMNAGILINHPCQEEILQASIARVTLSFKLDGSLESAERQLQLPPVFLVSDYFVADNLRAQRATLLEEYSRLNSRLERVEEELRKI